MTLLQDTYDSITTKVLLSKNEGREAGKSVVRCLSSAHSSIIEAAVLIHGSMHRFAESRSALEGFLDVLVEGGVVARSDARLGENASKLSVYRKVGEFAALLSDLRHYFDPSLYIYYDVVRLYEVLGRDVSALERQLAEIAVLGVSREALQRAIRDQKPSKRHTPAVANFGQNGGQPNLAPNHRFSTVGGEFGLILATPNESDLRLLVRDLVSPGGVLPPCMSVHEWTSMTAVLFVISHIVDIPIVVQRLLPYCGFSDASHVFLLDDPANHEVTHNHALTVACRGEYTIAPARIAGGIKNGLCPTDLVAPFATEDDGRLHIFAAEETSGWSSFIGAENWSGRVTP